MLEERLYVSFTFDNLPRDAVDALIDAIRGLPIVETIKGMTIHIDEAIKYEDEENV